MSVISDDTKEIRFIKIKIQEINYDNIYLFFFSFPSC